MLKDPKNRIFFLYLLLLLIVDFASQVKMNFTLTNEAIDHSLFPF